MYLLLVFSCLAGAGKIRIVAQTETTTMIEQATRFVPGPDGQWECDNPRCPVQCNERCSLPVCGIQCTGYCPHGTCNQPWCWVRCPPNPTPLDINSTCPACEVVCNPPSCPPSAGNFSIVCEELTCSWDCNLDQNCPKPVCHQVAEQVACMTSNASLNIDYGFGVLVVTLFVIILIT